jgi:hypothetical protein
MRWTHGGNVFIVLNTGSEVEGICMLGEKLSTGKLPHDILEEGGLSKNKNTVK